MILLLFIERVKRVDTHARMHTYTYPEVCRNELSDRFVSERVSVETQFVLMEFKLVGPQVVRVYFLMHKCD